MNKQLIKVEEKAKMKKVIVLLMALIMTISLGACSKKNVTDDNYGDADTATPAKTVITIGVDDSYPPMEFRDENNKLVGFDIDFGTALAEEMGVEFEYIPTAWDGIFVGLTSDKYDCIISSVSLTPERLESYEFTNPYLSNGQVIVVAPGDESIQKPEDLAGKKVGVQIETTADIAAEKQNALTPFDLTKYDTIMETFEDLNAGRLECVVVDYAVAIDYATNNPEKYVITSAQLTNEPIAICIKKGNTQLKDQMNEAIKKLQENGKLKEISVTWFNEDYTSDIDGQLR